MTDSRPPLGPASDPLLERLQGLRRDLLDDVAAARTLARAEAALAAAPPARPRLARGWLVPAALALWSVFYVGSALGALRAVFATTAGVEAARTASVIPRAAAVEASGPSAAPIAPAAVAMAVPVAARRPR